jgi:hypothetical protein
MVHALTLVRVSRVLNVDVLVVAHHVPAVVTDVRGARLGDRV